MPFSWEIALFDDRGSSMKSMRRLGITSRCAGPSSIPPAESVFQPVRDCYGWRLALVFGNHAPGGLCPYYTGERCFHCDIGAGEGAAFDLKTNRRRLAWFQEYYRPHLASISHLVLYNSGSFLNPLEMPPEFLDEIVGFASSLPTVAVISLDSREPFIKPSTLKRILEVAPTKVAIHPILGIESSDDRIRNDVLRKGMSRGAINQVFDDLSQLAAEFGPSRIGLDVNIVIGGPGTCRETAIDDAVSTARFALTQGAEHGIRVDLNLHPYYPGARGLSRFADHPRCSLATMVEVGAIIADLVRSEDVATAIFMGWNDEGHDTERRQREVEIAKAGAAFDRFNQTNDSRALDELRSYRMA
jgi:hypothetical protein